MSQQKQAPLQTHADSKDSSHVQSHENSTDTGSNHEHAPDHEHESECGHDHSHDAGIHGHHHITVDNETSGGRLLATLVLNLIIPVAQVIGGIMANSMALVSDAIHNFSDFTAVLISYIAFRIGKKRATLGNTFGYRRAEVMAALINVGILFGASLVIVYEAIKRFSHPEVKAVHYLHAWNGNANHTPKSDAAS